jgi:p-methyltransferase
MTQTPTTFYNAQIYFHDPMAPVERRRDEFGIVGQYYNWRHATMDWQQAAHWQRSLLRSIDGSTQLPLYGFSIWSLPYLLQKGFTLAQIDGFAKIARGMMIDGLDDADHDHAAAFARIRTTLAGWTPPASMPAAEPLAAPARR